MCKRAMTVTWQTSANANALWEPVVRILPSPQAVGTIFYLVTAGAARTRALKVVLKTFGLCGCAAAVLTLKFNSCFLGSMLV